MSIKMFRPYSKYFLSTSKWKEWKNWNKKYERISWHVAQLLHTKSKVAQQCFSSITCLRHHFVSTIQKQKKRRHYKLISPSTSDINWYPTPISTSNYNHKWWVIPFNRYFSLSINNARHEIRNSKQLCVLGFNIHQHVNWLAVNKGFLIYSKLVIFYLI